MSATVDTNILVYAANTDDEAYPAARDLLERLARGPDLLYLFWPSIIGFLRIVTRPALFAAPYSLEDAIGKVRTLIERPNVRTPGEQPGFLDLYAATAPRRTRGDHVPDAHLATLMRQHGVRVIYTRDRDFRRYDGIEPRDPFVES
jgi:toxin-antitoxin system PIN domain toxin